MLEMQITPATIILGIVIIALLVAAFRRLRNKGLCDCKDCSKGEGSCASCSSVDKMLKDMEKL